MEYIFPKHTVEKDNCTMEWSGYSKETSKWIALVVIAWVATSFSASLVYSRTYETARFFSKLTRIVGLLSIMHKFASMVRVRYAKPDVVKHII